MLTRFRLWLLSQILPGLIRVPATMWRGLLNRVRELDQAALTNEEKQNAAEIWLRNAIQTSLVAHLIPPGGSRRIVQAAVIYLRLQDLFFPAPSTPSA